MAEKSSSIALILSFLFIGVGINYIGNPSKGIGLFLAGVICNILGMFVFGFFYTACAEQFAHRSRCLSFA